jgi:hypothetical protein
MECGGELLRVSLPAVVQRYIGYKPAGAIELNPWEKDERYIGTLTYSSEDGILQRVALIGIGGSYEDKFWLGSADISLVWSGEELQQLTLFAPLGSRDPKWFTNFSVRLRFGSGCTVEIPVIEDEFFINPDAYKDCEIIRVTTAKLP